jgi:hypothetical protein
LAYNADWDLEMLRMELEALVEQSFDPAPETFGLWGKQRESVAEMEPEVKTWRGCWRASDPKEDIR